MTAPSSIDAVVESRTVETPNIVSITLRTADGSALPPWKPGDHIDVETPVGTRQYSLCGSLGAETWMIAVLDEPGGRGGSRWVHDEAIPGATLTVGLPRSTFHREHGDREIFIAGGVGVTPLIPMIEQAKTDGRDWSLIYTARDADGHAFRTSLSAEPRATLWTSSTQGRYDLGTLFTDAPEGTVFACCGPNALIDAALAAAEACGRRGAITVEHFEAAEFSTEGDRPFALDLAKQGITVEVAADAAAIDALAEAGVFVPNSCREGICGSCETIVLEGDVLHRDSLLDESERAANDCFYPCVSRAKGTRLLIDL